jgi:hypothetical protein
MGCVTIKSTDFSYRQWAPPGRFLLILSLCLGLVGCGGTDRAEIAPASMSEGVTNAVTIVSPTATPTPSALNLSLETASASLQVSSSTARVGDTLDVALHLSGVEKLYAVEVHLSLDLAAVSVIDAEPDEAGIQMEHGELLSPDFVIQNVISSTSGVGNTGVAHYAVSQMPPKKSISGTGALVTMHMEAASPGQLSIAVDSLILATVSGQAIPVEMKAREVRLPIE